MKNTEKKITNICKDSLRAAESLTNANNKERNKALKLIAKKILKNQQYILKQNKKDIAIAKKNNLSKHLLDRLLLDSNRVLNLYKDILNI